MKGTPLSIILSFGLLGLGIVFGLFELRKVELFSFPGLFHTGGIVLMAYTIFALFYQRNIGRLLAAAQFGLGGALIAVVCIFASMGGAPLSLLLIDILLATLQLTLAWHLLAGGPARKYATQEQPDVRA